MSTTTTTFMFTDDECVGDSSKDILGNLKHTAKVLLQEALLDVRLGEAKNREPKSLDSIIRSLYSCQLSVPPL